VAIKTHLLFISLCLPFQRSASGLHTFAQGDHGDDFNVELVHLLSVLQESLHSWGYHRAYLFLYHFVGTPQEITIQDSKIWQQGQLLHIIGAPPPSFPSVSWHPASDFCKQLQSS
jgi:hypothetical protein